MDDWDCNTEYSSSNAHPKEENASAPEIVKLPIANSYWALPGKFLAGEYPRGRNGTGGQDPLAKRRALLEAGVTQFIDLTEEGELLPYAGGLGAAEHRRFGIPDGWLPATPEATAEILDAIDRHIADGGVVYLHCWGGIGRTGTIVGCWLARHYGLSGEAALARLGELWRQNAKSARHASPEYPWQRDYIRQWREPG